MSTSTYTQDLDRHYTKNWSAPIESIRFNKGRVNELPEDFRILVIKRSPKMIAFATRCMSQPEDNNRLELHVLGRPEERREFELVEILTAVAHYHRTGNPLGLGHTVNFGKPWVAGSDCAHGLISLPYLDGPNLEWLAEPKVRFLWLIPITEAELQFKKSKGLEALEERFEEVQFNFLDPFRASVV